MRDREYDLFVDGDLFIVRWRNPTEAAARALASNLERQNGEHGAPLFFAILIGPECPPPSKVVREVMLRQHDRIYELTKSVHVVVMPGTVRQTVMRSVMTGMKLAAGLRGQPFCVDKTVPDLAQVIEKNLGRQPTELLLAMIESGMINHEEAGLPGPQDVAV